MISFLLISVLFAALYKIVPDVELKWSDVALGATITSLLFVIGKQLIGLYFAHASFGSGILPLPLRLSCCSGYTTRPSCSFGALSSVRCTRRQSDPNATGKLKRPVHWEIDLVLVRLDRWGRSVTDLLATLQEHEHLGVGFVSLTEALDLTTPARTSDGRPFGPIRGVSRDAHRKGAFASGFSMTIQESRPSSGPNVRVSAGTQL